MSGFYLSPAVLDNPVLLSLLVRSVSNDEHRMETDHLEEKVREGSEESSDLLLALFLRGIEYSRSLPRSHGLDDTHSC